ncbi:MAG: DUF262 domain-containing protein [Flavobacteriales bacterium]|nr:DUF262 domain-containing protein [Flavobacteriales bacterium]
MKNKIYVKPEKSRLINLLDDIKSGRIRIPVFQRDYVWKKTQRLELFDSLNNGFPIGSLLFWKPQELVFNFNNKIGPFFIEYNSTNYSYVLDGFQRVSTLLGALINPFTYENGVDKNIVSDYIIYYDLKDEEFVQLRGKEEIYQIPIYKLIDTFEFLSFSEKIREIISDIEESSLYINRAKRLANQLLDYEIPFVEIIGGEIEDAVEIFHRVNSKGSDISPIWMLNALTYVEDEFRFHNEITELKDRLEKYNFHELPSDIILHCIETSTGRIYFDVKLKSLAKDKKFPQLVKETFQNIEKAVEFLYKNTFVFDSKILPYNLQLIFITEFFRLNKNPSQSQLRELENWFWTTSYANYFSIYSLSKQRKAFQHFQEFSIGKLNKSVYNDDVNQKFKTLNFPDKINYGSVRSKCLSLFLVRNYFLNENVNYSEINIEFKYLINKGKKAEMAIPIDKNNFNFNLSKRNDLSFLLEDNFLLDINHDAYFIDNKMIELYKSNRIDELIEYRKNVIIKSEYYFVEKLGLEYFDSEYLWFDFLEFENEGKFGYDFEVDIPLNSIKKNTKNLVWDYKNKIVRYSEDDKLFDLFNINELIDFLNEKAIQDVHGEMPLHIIKANENGFDYENMIIDFLRDNYNEEIHKINWKI